MEEVSSKLGSIPNTHMIFYLLLIISQDPNEMVLAMQIARKVRESWNCHWSQLSAEHAAKSFSLNND
jgi:hypothetical protein